MTNLRDRERYAREIERENQIARENNNAAGGLLLGIILTSVIGLIVGAFFLTSDRNTPQSPRTTIIERTREAVPVPQPQAPQAPDVNVTVPQPELPNPPDIEVNIPSPAAPVAPEAPTSESAPAGDATTEAPSTDSETAPAQP